MEDSEMKKLLIFIMILIPVLGLQGCGKTIQNQQNESDNSMMNNPQVESNNSSMNYSTAINYSPFLRLPSFQQFEKDYDGLQFQVVNYGRYLTVIVTNNDAETRSFGGEYQIQRKIDGSYTDVPHDTFDLIYGGKNVKNMPHVKMYDLTNESEIEIQSEEEIINIDAGQKIEIDFMTMNYEIYALKDYAGEYRLVYGDMYIDFIIEYDVAC